MDPGKSMRAALRLEALGKESIPVLIEALRSDCPLVRFCAAESLAYLGNPTGVEELASLAKQFDSLRAYCLMAMAALDESACHIHLVDLMSEPSGELRYGAFRALRLLNEVRAVEDQDPECEANSSTNRSGCTTSRRGRRRWCIIPWDSGPKSCSSAR